MIKDIAFIIEDLVSSIDNTIDGTFNVSENFTEYCDTKWARKGKTISDSSGNEFLITGIEYDENITSDSLTPPLPVLNGETFLPKPFFISGTKKATNREWTISGSNVTEKTPIVWLLETLRERKFGRESVFDFESEVRLFFLDETNVREFYTEDHRREVVYPMAKLVESFIGTVKKNRKFLTIEDYTIKSFSRFGVEQENGMFQNVLDANLSGVELIITLTKYKDNCKC
jgi:hypothetical protein